MSVQPAENERGDGAALARRELPFGAIVSPYHLTTRDPAALVALQLASSCTTLLIAPQSGGAGEPEARAHARMNPAYTSYMRSWSWAMPLFQEGVLGSVHDEDDPVDDVRVACARLQRDPACAALAPYLREGLLDDDAAYLRAASGDVLKGGPDPGVSIPISAGLDAFASRHGLVVARPAPASVVQRAESALGRVLFRVSVPAIVRGSAERVLLARALLETERERLARAVGQAFLPGMGGVLRDAAVAYADAFERERADISVAPGPLDDDEVRLVLGEAVLTGVELPADAVLRSGVRAASGWASSGRADDGFEGSGGGVRALYIRSAGRRR